MFRHARYTHSPDLFDFTEDDVGALRKMLMPQD